MRKKLWRTQEKPRHESSFHRLSFGCATTFCKVLTWIAGQAVSVSDCPIWSGGTGMGGSGGKLGEADDIDRENSDFFLLSVVAVLSGLGRAQKG